MKYVIPFLLLIVYISLICFQVLNKEVEFTFQVQFSEHALTASKLREDISLQENIRFISVSKEIDGIIIQEPPTEKKSFYSGPTYHGNVSNEKIVYLTFDDGPSKNTEVILDLLKNEGISATFFVNGKSGTFEIELYKRIVAEGHAIGNHTYSHDYSLIYQSKKEFLEDFLKLENLLVETIGFAPKLMRFPGGSNNTISHRYGGKNIMKEIVETMTTLGYHHTDWNVDSKDSALLHPSKEDIVEQVLHNLNGKNELVVLFHDSHPKTTTPEALKEVIFEFKKQNYQFEAMNENSYFIQYLSMEPKE